MASAAKELEAGFSPNSQHFLSSIEVVQVESAAGFCLGQHRARPARAEPAGTQVQGQSCEAEPGPQPGFPHRPMVSCLSRGKLTSLITEPFGSMSLMPEKFRKRRTFHCKIMNP